MASISMLSSSLDELKSRFEGLCRKRNDIGTLSDGPFLRQEIQQDVKDIADTTLKIKQIISTLKENGENIDSYEKEFEVLGKRMNQELPKIIQVLKQRDEAPPSSYMGGSSISAPLMDQQEVDGVSDQIENLEIQVREILSTMRQLNEIFTQTLEELQRQRNVILSIDNSVSSAHDHMKSGTDNLNAASRHQKGVTKCMCWLALFFFIVAVGAGIFCWIYFTRPSNNSSPTPTPAPTPAPSTAPSAANVLMRFI